ncbi:magnesium chelatase subunit D [Rhodobacter ferrooxidans]|uniref:Magnesium chelatase subunit D n=1 Tax=Rhodobacter ferrooxidans TaxID=371731 RepID=C8RYP2_9RHOB|nr:magnesium chelatase subunit D [Rhodobacter sp. SW2]
MAPWARAKAALTLLAIDPAGLRGLWLRARSGPVRDRLTAAFTHLPLPLRRMHPGVADDALYGGVDLAATLASGHAVRARGILDARAAVVLAMAERCPPGLAVRLGQWLDTRGSCVIALDEGAEADETPPHPLTDRLGLFVDLSDIAWSEATDLALDDTKLAAARERLDYITTPPEALETLTRLAARLGIASLRAPLLAVAAARASAAWRAVDTVAEPDLRLAADLIYAHRALPEAEYDQPPPEDDTPPPPPPPG